MIWMCQEVIELGQELRNRNYNLTELTMEQLEEAARILLDKFEINEIPVDIVYVAEKMGLELLKVNFKDNEDNHIGGALAVSSKLQEQGYKKDKVIKVNKNNSQGHQRFTIVHEFYHYIFDSFFRQHNHEYYDVFNEDSLTSNDINEQRANRFAASFLMPIEEFTKEFLYLSFVYKLKKVIISQLANKFLVSEKAVEMRMSELNLTVNGN